MAGREGIRAPPFHGRAGDAANPPPKLTGDNTTPGSSAVQTGQSNGATEARQYGVSHPLERAGGLLLVHADKEPAKAKPVSPLVSK